MKKKVVWLVVTGGMVAALLLASCAPAAVEKVTPAVKEKEEVVVPKEVVLPKEEANFVKWVGKKVDGTVVEKMLEKPRYGGTYITARPDQPTVFNRSLLATYSPWNLFPTNEDLTTKDWTRGTGGTGEWSAQVGFHASISMGNVAGVLAESWELPDPATVVVHIRQGVHFALDPASEASRLVGGRELTADDVVLTLRREWTMGYHRRTFPNSLIDMKNLENSIYVSPTDKWAVVIKTQPDTAWLVFERLDVMFITAREFIEKYGNVDDWRNVVGTGPFILKDYVGASSLTWVRNLNYWGHDPFFPQNQLPYLDTLKVLIIPDASSRMAGLRTGQIDSLYDLKAEDAESLLKTNPKLERVEYISARSDQAIWMKVDTKPFDDVRVRRALTMGINRRELVDVYYEGKAVLFTWPIPPVTGFMDLFIPLEELPESVQELYEYKPDKARQLLAEAGYPQGFKTEILVWRPEDIDMLQIIKEYWAKIGVDLKIDVRDFAVYTTLSSRKTFKEMIMSGLAQSATQSWQSAYMNAERPGSFNKSMGSFDKSVANDPWVAQQINAVVKAMAADLVQGKYLNNRESTIYRSEQAWVIPLPEPYLYVLWQPWLKGYYGTLTTTHTVALGYVRHVWIDQDLKKAMGR